MNLSWFSSPNSATADNLIDRSTSITAYYALGEDSISYEEIWVSNQGNEITGTTLVDFGFYIESENLNTLNELLNYNLFEEAGKPCGLFIVFGYSDNTGETSYIDNFLAGELSPEDMKKFQVNWTQGTNQLNAIKMATAYTYDKNGTYSQRSNLQLNGGPINLKGENKGVLRIAVILRLPRLGTEKAGSFISEIRLKAHALKEIYDA